MTAFGALVVHCLAFVDASSLPRVEVHQVVSATWLFTLLLDGCLLGLITLLGRIFHPVFRCCDGLLRHELLRLQTYTDEL